jgi:hypothetical protein
MMVAVPPQVLRRYPKRRVTPLLKALLLGKLMIGSASCSSSSNCVELGTDPFENLKAVSALAARLGLNARQDEAAFIVGAAKAISDLGGKRVGVCLRSGEDNDAEFRVVSMDGNHMDQWTSISKSMSKRPSDE